MAGPSAGPGADQRESGDQSKRGWGPAGEASTPFQLRGTHAAARPWTCGEHTCDLPPSQRPARHLSATPNLTSGGAAVPAACRRAQPRAGVDGRLCVRDWRDRTVDGFVTERSTATEFHTPPKLVHQLFYDRSCHVPGLRCAPLTAVFCCAGPHSSHRILHYKSVTKNIALHCMLPAAAGLLHDICNAAAAPPIVRCYSGRRWQPSSPRPPHCCGTKRSVMGAPCRRSTASTSRPSCACGRGRVERQE